jgi:hypothetical protein
MARRRAKGHVIDPDQVDSLLRARGRLAARWSSYRHTCQVIQVPAQPVSAHQRR